MRFADYGTMTTIKCSLRYRQRQYEKGETVLKNGRQCTLPWPCSIKMFTTMFKIPLVCATEVIANRVAISCKETVKAMRRRRLPSWAGCFDFSKHNEYYRKYRNFRIRCFRDKLEESQHEHRNRLPQPDLFLDNFYSLTVNIVKVKTQLLYFLDLVLAPDLGTRGGRPFLLLARLATGFFIESLSSFSSSRSCWRDPLLAPLVLDTALVTDSSSFAFGFLFRLRV